MKQHYFDEQAQRAHNFVLHTAHFLELLVALVVIIAIMITFSGVPNNLKELFTNRGFNDFLKDMFNIIIGIELLKMLCQHSLDSVVEVLLFAVARMMIIGHVKIWEMLIGIVAIAILFLIRKFLFVSALDKQNSGE